MKQKIIILDFETGTTHIFDYDSSYHDAEEFFEDVNERLGYNFSSKNCEYMIVDNLTIEIH